MDIEKRKFKWTIWCLNRRKNGKTYSEMVVVCLLMFIFSCSGYAQSDKKRVVVAAEQPKSYLPMIGSKVIAVVANPTSMVGKSHLVDTLLQLGVQIAAVFAPEHGFRGQAEAGESVSSGFDSKTGLKIVSLYGDHKKPSMDDLTGVELVVFDIQDVGVRFYTYISTLQYVMEACARKKIPVLVLDRPNPHGNYIDGPVLKDKFKSFVGMQNIPVIHGLTVAEYALMLNGEYLLEDSLQCELKYVKVENWNHSLDYQLPVAPSPNLPNDMSIRLYPSLCLFEGTAVSIGRGTSLPFQCYGYPGNKSGKFCFTPKSIPGKSKQPLYENKKCYGYKLTSVFKTKRPDSLHLEWLIDAWKNYPDKQKFFNSFFEKLAGNNELQKQIESGMSEQEIRLTWQTDLDKYRIVREKYLLYK